jgi:hypothetical protein
MPGAAKVTSSYQTFYDNDRERKATVAGCASEVFLPQATPTVATTAKPFPASPFTRTKVRRPSTLGPKGTDLQSVELRHE